MKLNVMALANASAGVTAVIYVVCALAFIVLPDLSMQIASSWFHGFSLSGLGQANLTLESLVLGLVTSVAGTWAVGYVFALVYNSLVKK